MLFWVKQERLSQTFPPVAEALSDPDGLLAVGGDLSPGRLLDAYRAGIFPWFSGDQPILWWSPDPRAVLRPDRIHISRSLARRIRRTDFAVTCDRAFEAVMRGCAEPRQGQFGTWINEPMIGAYSTLHRLGHAHSIEVWRGDELAGGLYGVAIGGAFFGESMFTRRTDASKVALVNLGYNFARWGGELIDCQISNPHLSRMGAEAMSRGAFTRELGRLCARGPVVADWPAAWCQLETPEAFATLSDQPGRAPVSKENQ